ncbi:MAG: ubiquinone biosynthesis accessory factor UbiJ [Sodalis sp. Psp]|nr:ubiquinone biosynthesis accessory factor UbiJ [Sodalis sp. Psp]MCR3756895.1 ubiquinone biosynthesis accessory factor UbiJ [Sodalis sp. Ppy]
MLVQLMSATLEIALNRLLYQDRSMAAARQRLKGKVLRFELVEWNVPIILVFSARQVDVLNTWGNPADCMVRTRLATLSALVERQQLARMIQQGDIDVEGDLHLVQQFATLLDIDKFDAAELLVPWVGDIAAEGVTRLLGYLLNNTLQLFRTEQIRVAQVITDEWRLVPAALELTWFCNEVNNVARAGKNLVARLEKLEVSR